MSLFTRMKLSFSDDVMNRIKKNTIDFFNGIKQTTGHKVEGEVKGKTTAQFYKTFAPANQPKPAMTVEGHLTCKDLVKMFWSVK